MSSGNFFALTSAPLQIGKSLAVIAAIEFFAQQMRTPISNLSPQYAGMISTALSIYLQFWAYRNGWIEIPATSLGSML